jgi:hypothetical protein
MLSEVEASLTFFFVTLGAAGATVRDGKPGLVDFVGYVRASTVLASAKLRSE